MPETTTIPSVRTPPAATGGRADATALILEGERLEEPLHTVPYPVEPCHAVCLDTRDVDDEDDAVRYQSARW